MQRQQLSQPEGEQIKENVFLIVFKKGEKKDTFQERILKSEERDTRCQWDASTFGNPPAAARRYRPEQKHIGDQKGSTAVCRASRVFLRGVSTVGFRRYGAAGFKTQMPMRLQTYNAIKTLDKEICAHVRQSASCGREVKR